MCAIMHFIIMRFFMSQYHTKLLIELSEKEYPCFSEHWTTSFFITMV